MSEIEQRKTDHLELCATDEVAFKRRTHLLECVQLVHQSLPEMARGDVDLGIELLGKRLRAPIVIAAMTGGSDRSAEVNRELSSVAQARGYGFGLGSQRAMQRNPDTAWTYEVRKHAPDVLLLGNVGVVQARDLSTDALSQLVSDVGADALCLHMNPAMEMVQSGGDQDFRGCIDTYARLVAELPVPVVAKETGNGVSRQVSAQLRQVGVRHVDVSGAGGTSWVGVETLRAEGEAARVGEALWDWGIPTAASIAYTAEHGHTVIATGGIRSGVDVARAIAMGATAAGIARPVLQALGAGGRQAVEDLFDQLERELSTVMLLSGARTISDLQAVPRVISGELRDWLDADAHP